MGGAEAACRLVPVYKLNVRVTGWSGQVLGPSATAS